MEAGEVGTISEEERERLGDYFSVIRVSKILSLSRRDYEVSYEDEQEEDTTRSCTGKETGVSGVWRRGGVGNCV